MEAVDEESADYFWLLEDTTTITSLEYLIPLVFAVGLFSQSSYISITGISVLPHFIIPYVPTSKEFGSPVAGSMQYM